MSESAQNIIILGHTDDIEDDICDSTKKIHETQS